MKNQYDKVLIWSFEHNAWWRPNSRGYTHYRIHAGQYDRADAEKIVNGANEFLSAGSPNERIVELNEAQP